MNANAELETATIDYAKTRAVFEEYRATKCSRKYYAEHEADIEIHRVARATFHRLHCLPFGGISNTLFIKTRKFVIPLIKSYNKLHIILSKF